MIAIRRLTDLKSDHFSIVEFVCNYQSLPHDNLNV
jgi:hypothetical protein